MKVGLIPSFRLVGWILGREGKADRFWRADGLGGGNNPPSGQCGLYVYGRTGAGVVVQNAFRYLKAK